MARTPLMRALQQLAREHGATARLGIPVEELRERLGILRRGGRLHARAGPRRALPRLRRDARGSRDDPRHHVRRPARHRRALMDLRSPPSAIFALGTSGVSPKPSDGLEPSTASSTCSPPPVTRWSTRGSGRSTLAFAQLGGSPER
jgi:hypothetical protein